MQFSDVVTAIFQYGGTVIMAALFVWVFIEDKRKNTKMLEDNTKMLQTLVRIIPRCYKRSPRATKISQNHSILLLIISYPSIARSTAITRR